jgi:amidase
VAAALAVGRVSAREAVEAQRERLAGVHERCNCVAAWNDAALEEANALDEKYARAGPVGPLHGVPVTVKDWIDVTGMPCTGGAVEHRDRRPKHDATAAARLRAAGAIVVAKTTVGPELPVFGRVRHPTDPERSPGGSSSGEAVAVAAGASPLGLGSDSGGSIRLPAAWCGAAGHKPTAGRVPVTGHFPAVGARHDGRTQIGPIARTVDDLRLALALIAGPDGLDPSIPPVDPLLPAARDLSRLRVAVITSEAGFEPEAAIRSAVAASGAALEAAGAAIVDSPGPWLADARDITERYWHRANLTGADADQQLSDWDRFARRCLRDLRDIDITVLPATSAVAPPHRQLTGDDYAWTLPASLSGGPAVALPFGVDHSGLPVAVQLLGRPWTDSTVLAAAALVEQAAPR